MKIKNKMKLKIKNKIKLKIKNKIKLKNKNNNIFQDDWTKRWGKTACRNNSQVRVPAPTRVWELCVSTLTC